MKKLLYVYQKYFLCALFFIIAALPTDFSYLRSRDGEENCIVRVASETRLMSHDSSEHPIIALFCIFKLSALASIYFKANIKLILWTLFKITVRNRVKADKITIKPQPQTNQGERSTPRPTYEESVISLHYFVTGICLFFQIAVHTRMLCANKKIRVCTFTM